MTSWGAVAVLASSLLAGVVAPHKSLLIAALLFCGSSARRGVTFPPSRSNFFGGRSNGET